MSRRYDQELAEGGNFQPLLSIEEPPEFPQLAGGETYEWAVIANLDTFFTRVYRYWLEKGFATLAVSGLFNLSALAFTIAFSGFLLIFVNWGALHSECLVKDTCDIIQVAIYHDPLSERSLAWMLLCIIYLLVFTVYWIWAIVHYVMDLVEMIEIRHFYYNKLGVSARQIKVMTWAEVVHRIVLLQRTMRLCVARDLTEHDVVSRITRKDNYMVGMLNKGVLSLQPPLPGMRRRVMLTKTLEWNLKLAIFDNMFDQNFQVRHDFLSDTGKLRRRFKLLAAANLLVSPFLFLFLVIYFFMRNAESFYHNPGAIGSRRWSALAEWRLRELNELPHFLRNRLLASQAAAAHYVAQFPSPITAHIARFVAYIAGSFAALLLFVTLLDEKLLERSLFGRHLVWWAATLGVVLAVSRSFAPDDQAAPDPERAMTEVATHTHYLPRHWRGRAGSEEVQTEFQQLFQYKALLFLDEMFSVLLTPFVLYFTLPNCAGSIISFVRNNTTRVVGVGDICSLAAFDFDLHGNAKYGAPTHSPKDDRSRQGKMEKSFLTFVTTYPTWEPPPSGRRLISRLAEHTPSHANHLDNSAAAASFLHLPPTARSAAASQHTASRIPHHLPMPNTSPHPAPSHPPASMFRSQFMPPAAAAHLGVEAFRSIHQAHFPPAPHTQETQTQPSAASSGRSNATSAVSISESLPVNETQELDSRLVIGHSLLQNFYEDREETVGHRLRHRRSPLAPDPLPPQYSQYLGQQSQYLGQQSQYGGQQSQHLGQQSQYVPFSQSVQPRQQPQQQAAPSPPRQLQVLPLSRSPRESLQLQQLPLSRSPRESLQLQQLPFSHSPQHSQQMGYSDQMGYSEQMTEMMEQMTEIVEHGARLQ